MPLCLKCDTLGIECEAKETSKDTRNKNRLPVIHPQHWRANVMNHWSMFHQQQIQLAIETAFEQSDSPFAVFDADNTIWKHDIEEALLAWLEYRGLVGLNDLPASILPFPVRANDSLFSYYEHLSEMDHSICYLWACQAFAGFSLRDLHTEINKMLQRQRN